MGNEAGLRGRTLQQIPPLDIRHRAMPVDEVRTTDRKTVRVASRRERGRRGENVLLWGESWGLLAVDLPHGASCARERGVLGHKWRGD
jgi:hypothetical protein